MANKKTRRCTIEFIGSFWWLWLVSFLIFGVIAIANQFKRIKGMANSGFAGDMRGTVNAAKKGIGTLVISWIIASASGILLIISIIANLIAYYKH